MTTGRITKLVAQVQGTDPLSALRAVVEIRQELERREAVLVRRARVRGASWPAIAVVLGVSRQVVHRKHGGGWREGGGREQDDVEQDDVEQDDVGS
jgi:hypothetical protein